MFDLAPFSCLYAILLFRVHILGLTLQNWDLDFLSLPNHRNTDCNLHPRDCGSNLHFASSFRSLSNRFDIDWVCTGGCLQRYIQHLGNTYGRISSYSRIPSGLPCRLETSMGMDIAIVKIEFNWTRCPLKLSPNHLLSQTQCSCHLARWRKAWPYEPEMLTGLPIWWYITCICNG